MLASGEVYTLWVLLFMYVSKIVRANALALLTKLGVTLGPMN